MALEDPVRRVYAARDSDELLRRYGEWAEDYDRDLERDFGYLLPEAAADAVRRFVQQDAKVLDAGAGTGLVGDALQRLGYRHVDALDMSPAMLAVAAGKNVYAELFEMRLGEPLGFRDGRYDAAVAVGVLTLGHAPATALDELTRVVKPNGHVIFSLRDDVHAEQGFKEKHAELEAAGKWTLVEQGTPFEGLPKGEPGVYFRIWVYRVTAPPSLDDSKAIQSAKPSSRSVSRKKNSR